MDDMLDTMYDANGIGLAAIQIGVPKRIIVMDICKEEGKKERKIKIKVRTILQMMIKIRIKKIIKMRIMTKKLKQL